MDIIFSKIKWRYVSETGRKWLDSLDGNSVRLEKVKCDGQRSVHRHQDGIYVKKIRYKGLRSIYKTLIGGNAAKEGSIALSMEQRGIPVPEVMAFGRIKSWGMLYEDVLITKEIINAKSLHDFLEYDFPYLNYIQKKNVIKKFAGFIKRLHDRGVYHRDFHLKNVMIQFQEEYIRFSMLDLDKVVLFVNPVSWKKRSKQLGILMSICWELCSRSDRFRFVQYYAPEIKSGKKVTLMKDISSAARRHVNQLLSKRAKQSIRTNTRFVNETIQDLEICRKREFDHKSFFRGLNKKEGFTCKYDFTGKDSGKVALDEKVYFFKKYTRLDRTGRIPGVFGRSLGRCLWKNIWRFPFNKIPIPAPLMMMSWRKNEMGGNVYLISEFLADTFSLHEYWSRINRIDKKRLCAKMGMFIGTMHRFGAVHGNLDWKNIMICPYTNGIKIFLCDVHDFKNYRHVNRKKAEKDAQFFLEEMERHCADKSCISLFLRCWQKWAGF